MELMERKRMLEVQRRKMMILNLDPLLQALITVMDKFKKMKMLIKMTLMMN